MINKEVIKQRKTQYGNNFECIAKKWNMILKTPHDSYGEKSMMSGENISGDLVAFMMAGMKQCRIEAIVKKLDNRSLAVDQKEKLKSSLKDNVVDKANYSWIAQNYKEYEKL